ncbi:MAG: hypothetical protein JEZ11_02965 [Desulfobacterales bacterium]|nr:hypothetical protein [Desulfobacterales bacterium]
MASRTRSAFKRKFAILLVLLLAEAFFPPLPCRGETGTEADPLHGIDLWYGSSQTLGQPGLAQSRFNVLGNIGQPRSVTRMTFSVNGGPEIPLHLGPDQRRLVSAGDFNIELTPAALLPGENRLRISAERSGDPPLVAHAVITRAPGTWPLPYHVDWKRVHRVQEAVQVVDGRWRLDSDGLRTHPNHIGYDRVVAVGEVTWTDYEVLVVFRVHRIDPSAWGSKISVAPWLGVNLRWLGHTDHPVICPQPRCGWFPTGGSCSYEFGKNDCNRLKLVTGRYLESIRSKCAPDLEPDRRYWMRARVETLEQGHLYRFKFWKDGDPEPGSWSLQSIAPAITLPQGGFLLVAHHADVTFGNLTVTPLGHSKGTR